MIFPRMVSLIYVAHLFSKLAGFVRAGHDLVVEYGEVEGESKPSRDNDEAKWIKLSVVQV